ncbi:preprotein translocase subunit SecE [Thermomonas sp. HDW16]|uniref:preprotein translocase subunit SecE n=1 Tax=Thermomonas sp. HDW16 TaxID=2714945 RepID=UPI001407E355|nr:preprotein translocase subunit SecE [Thermomonas sp. HDW16]QIL21285.1 preprotein translocase subunit SecE [Thermomonas sp. HDW16]
MTSKTLHNQSTSGGDIVKYALALLLAAAGLFAFYWFDGQWPGGVRVLAVVAGLVAGALVFMTTVKGAETREFLSESRFELRKVVWPTRQETTRTMWVVIAVVILMSLLLAGMDLVIQAVVKWLLGNG